MTKEQLLDPIPPGEILSEEFMKPLGLSANKLARDIDVPPGRITEIIRGRRTITADTALRLGKYFGVSPEIWLNLRWTMTCAWHDAPSGPLWNPVSVSERHEPGETRKVIPKVCKRLAKAAFPIAEVSGHSAREKPIHHGHRGNQPKILQPVPPF